MGPYRRAGKRGVRWVGLPAKTVYPPKLADPGRVLVEFEIFGGKTISFEHRFPVRVAKIFLVTASSRELCRPSGVSGNKDASFLSSRTRRRARATFPSARSQPSMPHFTDRPVPDPFHSNPGRRGSISRSLKKRFPSSRVPQGVDSALRKVASFAVPRLNCTVALPPPSVSTSSPFCVPTVTPVSGIGS